MKGITCPGCTKRASSIPARNEQEMVTCKLSRAFFMIVLVNAIVAVAENPAERDSPGAVTGGTASMITARESGSAVMQAGGCAGEIEPNSAVPLWDTPAETTPCGTVEIDNLLIQQSIGGGIHQELMLNFARRDSLGASGANDAERPRNFASRRQHGSDGRRLLAFSRPGWLGPPWLALKVAYSRAYTSGSPHEQLLIGFIYTMRPGFARHTHL